MNIMKKKFNETNVVLWIITICAIILVATAWLWNYFTSFSTGFGDKFGVVNALFSGLAFAGIIITIYMQKKELELQRKELRKTKKVFKKQSRIMSEQQADNTFFNLLENHKRFVESLSDQKNGYEEINKLDKYWNEMLKSQDDYAKSKIITDYVHFKTNPVHTILADPIAFNFYQEVLNILEFIEIRFTSQKEKNFYLKTLLNNLTYQERFVFDVYYFYNNQNNEMNYQPKELLSKHYVNVAELNAPVLTTKAGMFRNDEPFYVEIVSDKYTIESCELFIIGNIYKHKEPDVIKEYFNIKPDLFNLKFDLTELISVMFERRCESTSKKDIVEGSVFVLKILLSRNNMKSEWYSVVPIELEINHNFNDMSEKSVKIRQTSKRELTKLYDIKLVELINNYVNDNPVQ